MGLEPGPCFATWIHVGKNGVSFQTFFKSFWPFQFEKCQTGPEGVWNRTSAFPLWSRLEKVGPGSKPFQNNFGPFHFESVHDNLGPHCSFQGCCWQAGVPITRVVVGSWPSGGFPLEGPFYSCQTDEWAATIMRRSRSRGSSMPSEGKGQELHALLESSAERPTSCIWELANKPLVNSFRVIFLPGRTKIEGRRGDLDPAALFD